MTAHLRIAPTAMRKMEFRFPCVRRFPVRQRPISTPRLYDHDRDADRRLRPARRSTRTSATRSARSSRERVAPRAAEIDATGEYPWDIRKLFAEQDILGLPFAEEYGGTGTGTLMLNVAVEEVAKACASSALILMVQELGTLPIQLFGTDEQKERWLPRCATRRVVAGVRAVRARGRHRPGVDAHHRRARRRRVGHQRHEELDHERDDRRLLRRVRRHRPRGAPVDARSSSRRTAPGFSVAQARAQARHQGLADRLAGLRGRARARTRT